MESSTHLWYGSLDKSVEGSNVQTFLYFPNSTYVHYSCEQFHLLWMKIRLSIQPKKNG